MCCTKGIGKIRTIAVSTLNSRFNYDIRNNKELINVVTVVVIDPLFVNSQVCYSIWLLKKDGPFSAYYRLASLVESPAGSMVLDCRY